MSSGFDMTTSDIHAAVTAPASTPPAAGGSRPASPSGPGTIGPFGADGFTFRDLLDIVNPLQHIPIISTLYQKLTGDTLAPVPELAGGALYGGLIGLAVAGADVMVEEATGESVGEHVLALFSGDAGKPPATAIADNTAGGKPAQPTAAAIPDLALLGPLPPPTAAAPTATAKARPAATPVIDLAALAPLTPATTSPNPTPAPAATVAARDAGPATPANSRDAAKLMAVRPAAGQGSGAPASGAVAADGGWFTQAMLSALEKYQKAAKLGDLSPQPTAVSATY